MSNHVELIEDLVSAIHAEDLPRILEVIESRDSWASAEAGPLNVAMQTLGMYGVSGRTDRFAKALGALLDRGAEPDLVTCTLLQLNDRALVLIEKDPATISAPDVNGAFPLHAAAERGNAELAKVLCERAADTNVRDQYNQTPLMRALHAGPWKTAPSNEVAELLRQHAAQIDLWTLAALGDDATLTTALTPTNINALDHDGSTALFRAAKNNHLNTVTLLLESGANAALPCTDGQTPLSTACLHALSQECDPAIPRALIAHGAEWTIEAAIVLDDPDRVEAFVSENESTLDGQDHESPLGYAIHVWRPEVLRRLLALGAKPSKANWGHIERIAGDDAQLVAELRSLAS